jgi:DNA-binding winged helix-turn-helix (wHTH) protein
VALNTFGSPILSLRCWSTLLNARKASRKALDHNNRPAYIETISHRDYRFIKPIEHLEPLVNLALGARLRTG